MIPVFTANRLISVASSLAPATSLQVRRRLSSQPLHRHRKPATESTNPYGRLCVAPRPLSARFEPVPRLRSFITGFSRIPSDLARRTRPVWQCHTVPALSALLAILPGVPRVRLRSAPAKLLRQLNEKVLHLLRFCEVDPERPAGVTAGGSLRVASRTRRAPHSAPGSPQVPAGSRWNLMRCSAMVSGCAFPGSSSAWR